MHLQMFFAYLAVSLVLGYLGREKALKFWGYFLLSLLLSPVIGLLALGIEEWITNRKRCKKDEPAATPVEAPAN